jgi:hypothetical protein
MQNTTFTIWSFIAAILAIYGLIIFGAGIYYCFYPAEVALKHCHASLWWGGILLIFGIAFQTLLSYNKTS